MSAYDRMRQEIDSKRGEDREAEIDGLRAECICPDCPTYNKCAEEAGDVLYCFLGKGKGCMADELGCNCPDCPVAAQAELGNIYYCINGSETEIRKR